MTGLTKEQIAEIREELSKSVNPLFFFDDDADGVCSYLLLKKYIKEGNGVIVKSVPKIDKSFLNRIVEYNADKVFILDIAIVEQDFIDETNCSVFWIDHHEPLARERIKIYNPCLTGKSPPTTYLCYQIANQDMWIAVVGCVADWYIPEFLEEFGEKYPDMIKGKPVIAPDIIYNEPLGKLIRIFSFLMKGSTSYVMKSISLLSGINSPYEILNRETDNGREIYARAEKVWKEYDRLYERARKSVTSEKIVYFEYSDKDNSFTSELSNELVFRHPDKIIFIAREKDDEMRMSIRSTKLILPQLIKKSLNGLDGYGGGHEHACGACVKKNNFEVFFERFKGML